jgi:hypothetical protein
LNEDGRRLYDAVPADGSKIASEVLRAALGWTAATDDRRYFATRNAVEDAGLIIRGEDRRGTVRRAPIVFRVPGPSGPGSGSTRRGSRRDQTRIRSLRSFTRLVDDVIDP